MILSEKIKKNASVLWGKAVICFTGKKTQFILNVFIPADTPPLTNIHEYNVRYQLLFYNRNGFVPTSV